MNGLFLVMLVSALSGFVALGYEIVWYRVVSFVSWGMPAAFGLLLGAYLLGLALGARKAGALCKEDASAGQLSALRRLAGFVFAAVVLAMLVVPIMCLLTVRAHWMVSLVFVVLAAGTLGAVLPLVSHFGIRPDARAGQRLSWVYLANIIGSSLGSFVTGFVWMDRYSLQTIATILAAFGFVLFAVVAVAAAGTMGRRAIAGAVAFACLSISPRVVAATYAHVYERLAFKRQYKAQRFAEIIETKSGVITTTDDGVVYGGGAYDGKFNTDIRSDRNGILRAYGVGAMHPSPKRILMIGLASGSWAQVLVHLPGVERVDAVEINPGYLELISRHEEVKSLVENPKFHTIIDDGRRYLTRHPDERFDVVVMNTTWHWRAHSTNLLSREFMDLVRAHLAPGGIFYFNTTGSDDAQRTAALTFSDAMRVYNFMAASDSPIVFDRTRWSHTLHAMAIDGVKVFREDDPDDRGALEGLLAYPDTLEREPENEGLESRARIVARTKDAKLITDDNMVPEWHQIFHEPPAM